MEKTPFIKAVIRFPDCDPFNHLNNSRYIDYFLNSREDQLLQFYDFSIYGHAKETGCGWVVGQHEIAYLKPAFTMETVLIESMVLRWGDRDILVEFRMWNEHRKVLKSVMWTKFYYFNLTEQKSLPHTTELNNRFSGLAVEIDDIQSFEKRVQQLRSGG